MIARLFLRVRFATIVVIRCSPSVRSFRASPRPSLVFDAAAADSGGRGRRRTGLSRMAREARAEEAALAAAAAGGGAAAALDVRMDKKVGGRPGWAGGGGGGGEA